MLKRVWDRLQNKLFVLKKYQSLTDYWRNRARQYGRYGVLNIAHNKKDFDEVTDHQKQLLFPLLKSQLNGSELNILDFGCGPGRFTNGLAELINGSATGVDIVPEFLATAPKSSLVSYQLIGVNTLPFLNASFDVVWSCLVLGGIPDGQVEKSIAEIKRILRPGGLFFYVENTTIPLTSTDYWFFRDEETYARLAVFCKPQVLGQHKDVGQTITIFAGKKSAQN